jgi:hypothetical protein
MLHLRRTQGEYRTGSICGYNFGDTASESTKQNTAFTLCHYDAISFLFDCRQNDLVGDFAEASADRQETPGMLALKCV